MFKKLLRLLSVFVGLVVLLAIPSRANAAVQSNDVTLAEVNNQVSFSPVNLNVFNPSLGMTSKSSDSLFAHLGCNCGICIQQSNQQQNL